MLRQSIWLKLLAILGIVVLAILAYIGFIRPWHKHWGATAAEVTRVMLGDEVVNAPDFIFTRAISIKATPTEVWPWIVQMGDQRAGFYAYDWFDNRGQPSAAEIRPELQQLAVGDPLPISSVVVYRVGSIEEFQAIVWESNDDPKSGAWTWGLYPAEDGQTRLVTRLRGKAASDIPSLIFHWIIDAGDFVFMRKSMLGIKQRAEGNITDTFAADVLEGVLWGSSLLQFSGAIGLILGLKRWLKAWLVALTIAAAFLFTFYARPPLLVGIMLQGVTFLALIQIYQTRAPKPVKLEKGKQYDFVNIS